MNSQCKKLQCPLITMGFSKFAHTAKVLLHMWPGRHWWLLVVWGAWDPRRFPQSLFLFPHNTLFSFRDPWWVTRAVWSVRGWRCPWCLESVIREYLLWFHLSIFLSLSLSLSLSLLLSSSLPMASWTGRCDDPNPWPGLEGWHPLPSPMACVDLMMVLKFDHMSHHHHILP